MSQTFATPPPPSPFPSAAVTRTSAPAGDSRGAHATSYIGAGGEEEQPVAVVTEVATASGQYFTPEQLAVVNGWAPMPDRPNASEGPVVLGEVVSPIAQQQPGAPVGAHQHTEQALRSRWWLIPLRLGVLVLLVVIMLSVLLVLRSK